MRATAMTHRVHDEVGAISAPRVRENDEYLDLVHDALGIDVQYLLTATADTGDIRALALREARRRRVGADVDGRGLLVVIDYATHRMAFEVGPRLQGVFTDAFTGYLLRNHLDAFTDRGEAESGLRMLTHLIAWRAENALLGDEWDPRRVTHERDSTRLAIGGGARLVMSDTGSAFGKPRLSPALKAYFGPQPTPEALLARYREWTVAEPIDMRVGLFTRGSQVLLDHVPYTRPFQDLEFMKTVGQSFRFIVRDSLGLMYSTSSPLISPSLLRRSAAGWQFDVASEWKCTAKYIGRGFTWGWVNCPEYDAAFGDALVGIDDVGRVRDGDNRRIPMGKTKFN